jgi:hypothetical protein
MGGIKGFHWGARAVVTRRGDTAMAKKKRYVVKLSREEREQLEQFQERLAANLRRI